MMVCEDLKSRTLTAICCSSDVLVHERRFKLGFGVVRARPWDVASLIRSEATRSVGARRSGVHRVVVARANAWSGAILMRRTG